MKLNRKVVDVLPQGGDIPAPKLHSLSMSSSSVDTSAGPATLTVTARFTDDLAGNAFGTQMRFRSPFGGQFVDAPSVTTSSAATASTAPTQPPSPSPPTPNKAPGPSNTSSSSTKPPNTASVQGTTLAAAGYPTTFEVIRTG